MGTPGGWTGPFPSAKRGEAKAPGPFAAAEAALRLDGAGAGAQSPLKQERASLRPCQSPYSKGC